MSLYRCNECGCRIDVMTDFCPRCGVVLLDKEALKGWGFEYRSKARFLEIPLLHISFRFRSNGRPVPAKGIVAIGQFGMGVLNISQFGVGLISVGQFTLAGYALAQIGAAWSLIAQIGIYWERGAGQLVWGLKDLFGL